MTRYFSILAASALLTAPAHAHLGHVAEVAGHGHAIAIGAIIAAAVVAGLVIKASKSSDETEPEEGEQAENSNEPTEAA